MLNRIFKLKNIETANAKTLEVKACGDPIEASRIASLVSDRFTATACMLPKNKFLGWQLNAESSEKEQIITFTGADVEITPDDYKWIYHGFTKIDCTINDFNVENFGLERNVYALKFSPCEQKNDENLDYENNWNSNFFDELLSELRANGAMLRVVIGSEHCGLNAILVSLQGEMTLRLRTLLSMAFIDTTPVKLVAGDKSADEISSIPSGYMKIALSELLEAVMLNCPEAESNEIYDNDCENYESEEDEIDEDFFFEPDETNKGITTIDDLNLSIRAYNCLMRAGIRTIDQLVSMSDEDLYNVRNLGPKCMLEIKRKLADAGYEMQEAPPAEQEQEKPNYSEMLNELIGLEGVKEQVKKITALAKMKKDMAQQGIASIPVVLNMEFVGNPGTAKTTVARIIAGIFYEIGLLKKNDIMEVGRADLVGRYVGHTADLVKKVFEQAKGKLLFVDEAYALAEKHSGNFGDEAINTIVQEMENNRNDTIVIFAGYPDKMKQFFSRNQGLRSRVPFQINFNDYTAEEMVQIAELEAKKRGFSIKQDALQKVSSICSAAVTRSDMGNGRFCRNLVENAILDYASRAYGNDSEDTVKDFVLTDSDFTEPEILHKTLQEQKKTAPIGFVA